MFSVVVIFICNKEKNIVNIKIIVNSYSNSNATLWMFWPRYWFSVSVNHSWLIAQVIFNSFLPLSLRWLQIIGLAANTIASQDISILLKTFVPYVPYTNWQNEEKSQYLCKRKYILVVCDSRYDLWVTLKIQLIVRRKFMIWNFDLSKRLSLFWQKKVLEKVYRYVLKNSIYRIVASRSTSRLVTPHVTIKFN